jgi:hypothetical protein
VRLQPEAAGTGQVGLSLDRPGISQALGGLVLGLIALFSSYDHISLGGRRIPLQQQWGIVFILASVATIFIDAQLATRSRLRAAHERLADRQRANRERYCAGRERNRADRERDLADRERHRAAEARERQAESLERQSESLERLDQAALLSARVQLDPSAANRERLQDFLTLIESMRPPVDEPL